MTRLWTLTAARNTPLGAGRAAGYEAFAAAFLPESDFVDDEPLLEPLEPAEPVESDLLELDESAELDESDEPDLPAESPDPDFESLPDDPLPSDAGEPAMDADARESVR